MKICPGCSKSVPSHMTRCPHCKNSFGTAQNRAKRFLILLLAGIIGGGALTWAYWHFKVRPRIYGLGVEASGKKYKPETIQAEPSAGDFDLKLKLKSSPIGLTYYNGEFVTANRLQPGGFVRLRQTSKSSEFESTYVPVYEPQYHQQVSFSAVTFNGKHVVGYTDGSWFNTSDKNIFTLHDPKSLAVLEYASAPPLIGCIVWDGSGYWAATRKNTEDAAETPYLYKLDEEFRITAQYTPPSVGCQGMAWDGRYLWIADVFSDSIHVLEPRSGAAPAPVQTVNSPFGYLSGIGSDGKRIWVTEYDSNSMYRMSPRLHARINPSAPFESLEPTFVSTSSPSEETKLRDEYDPVGDPEYPAEDTELISFQIYLQDGNLYGSWNIHFGQTLFDGISSEPPRENEIHFPTFTKYHFTIRGGTLSESIVKEYDAVAGTNSRNDELLASGLGPGRYDVDLFLYVQYKGSDGGYKILNNSASSLDVRQ